MMLTRCAVVPHHPRVARCVKRLVASALLVGAGVIGQQIADAIADADRWNERYELWMLGDELASQHPHVASCTDHNGELGTPDDLVEIQAVQP